MLSAPLLHRRTGRRVPYLVELVKTARGPRRATLRLGAAERLVISRRDDVKRAGGLECAELVTRH